jgi:hypothetical protein
MSTLADALEADPASMSRDQMRAQVMGDPEQAEAGPLKLPPPPPPVPEYQPPTRPPGEVVAELLADGWVAFLGDPDMAAPLAEAEMATLEAAVREAIAVARGSEVQAKAARLAGDLATTQAALEANKQAQKDALKAARRALAESQDPTPHEQHFQDSARGERVLANRLGTLSYLTEEARRAAASAARQAVQAALEPARQEIPERFRQALAEAAQAVKPFLPRILALHGLECELYDSKTGGLPSWAERLLEGETPPGPPKPTEPPAAAAPDDTPAATLPDPPAGKRRDRIARVVQKRQEGKSLRLIAEEEKVSLGQVQRDLRDAGEEENTGS